MPAWTIRFFTREITKPINKLFDSESGSHEVRHTFLIINEILDFHRVARCYLCCLASTLIS